MDEITKSEWVNWKNDRVTRAYIEALNTKREALKEGLAQDETGGDPVKIAQVQGRTMSLFDAILYATQNFDFIED